MKKLNKIFVSLFAVISLIFTSFSLTACGSDTEKSSAKQAPIYIGMEVVAAGDETQETESVSLMSYGSSNENYNNPQEYLNGHYEEYDYRDYHYHGDCHGRNDQIDQDYPFGGSSEDGESGTPSIEEVIEDESSLKYIGTDKDRYYAEPDEYIFVKIYFSNPDNYVILSFDFNGEAYASYMFQDGSTMQCIILKVNVGSISGLYDYTIDKIKYVDGSDIKDVLINGDQTVSVAVNGDGVTSASVTNEEIGLTSISFNVRLYDSYNLIEDANGFAKVYLYDGETIIAEQALQVGANSVIFENLQSNTIYQYAVVGYFDDLSGDGESLHTFTKKAFYTNTIVLFDSISVDYQNISYSYSWDEDATNKTITQAVYDASDLATPLDTQISEDNGTYTISNLLTNHEYVVVTTYKNTYNEDEYIYISFKTLERIVPAIEITDAVAGQENITFEISVTDTDNVGAITSIVLKHNESQDISLADLTQRAFTNLLSDNEYTIEVVYTYNLNDGVGDKITNTTYDITTLAKATPSASIDITNKTYDSVTAVGTFTDADNVGTIKSIKLFQDETEIKTFESIPDLSATNLDEYQTYKYVVEFEYDLNDGNGAHNETYALEFKTNPNITLSSTTIINTSAVLEGETIYLQAKTTNSYDDVVYTQVKINEVYYDVNAVSSGVDIYVNIVNDGQFAGGDTTLTIQKIIATLDGEEYTFAVSENNFDNIFINGTFEVVDFEIVKYVDGEYTAVDYVFPSDDVFYYITLENETDYTIDSVVINGTIYESSSIIKIDKNHYVVSVSLSTYLNTKSLTQVVYSNDYVTLKEYNANISDNCFKVISDSTKYIETYSDLLDMDDGYYYELVNDIDLSGIEWSNPGILYGVFNGKGYSIKNMSYVSTITVNSSNNSVGLFSDLNNAVVFDLKIEDVTIILDATNVDGESNTLYVGGLTGRNQANFVLLDNVSVSGVISVEHDSNLYVGGLIGYNYNYSSSTTISYCYATGNVSATSTSSNAYVGGLIGCNHNYSSSTMTITNCYTTGNVSATSTNAYSYAGGFIGSCDGTLTNCYATGDVSASGSSYSYAGGLIGSAKGTFINCYATGNINAATTHLNRCAYAGGLFGYISSSITIINCYSIGNVIATSTSSYAYGGGLFGYNYLSSKIIILNCYALGDVSVTSTNSYAYAGGLIGHSYNISASTITITNCYSTGIVIATSTNSQAYAGGLMGCNTNSSSTTTITNCYVTGNISVTSTSSYAYVGGLIGYNSSSITITNSYTSDQQLISITKGESTTTTPSNSYGEATALANLQDPTWLTETLGWGKYVSEEDLAENENNVWIFEKNEFPKLYYQN